MKVRELSRFCVLNTDYVTIPMRFESSPCSLKRLRASMKMSNRDFERKYSHHVLSDDLCWENKKVYWSC